jgi:2-phosphoglycerate kinase
LRVILIGGSSNVGKSAVAQSLALKLGWTHISTDSLARHPGRPWRVKLKNVPEHTVEHYISLSIDELFVDVLHHYKSLMPDIKTLITLHATDVSSDRLILEGSALWPEYVGTLDLENVAAIWLTASNNLFRKRINNASQYEEASIQEKLLIRKFLERTILYNKRMMAAINQLGLMSMVVEEAYSPEELSDRCQELLMK